MAAKSSFVDQNEVFMSYKSFLFLTSEEEISELKLVCQVNFKEPSDENFFSKISAGGGGP